MIQESIASQKYMASALCSLGTLMIQLILIFDDR